MSAAADTLKKVPLFAGLDDKELARIADRMVERRYKTGDKLTEQGASGIGFFVIEDGTADVTVDGEPKGSVGPGDYFGEVALLSGSARTRTATLIATTDMLTYGMTAWDFKPLVEGNSELASKLLAVMAARLG
ncbi:MAG TPA: cyclic nucleotide-binding domain-containing protein [Gaiellaceae bacterium]|nr:cyclic nucleotide-binding domain-containing protein [Gaiellaceae bacterium]